MRPTQSTVIHGLPGATVLLAPLSFIWRNAPKQYGRLRFVMILLLTQGAAPQHLAHAALPYVPRGIAVRSVRTDGLDADFFHGTSDKPQKAVILLGGSEGGKSFSDDNVFTGQQPADGVKWADITVTPALGIAMGSDAYVGLAVCSHDGALMEDERNPKNLCSGSNC